MFFFFFLSISWADVPVKIVGIFSQRNEKNILWKLIYNLFERRSIFHYGRVELIMFISQKEYTVSLHVSLYKKV